MKSFRGFIVLLLPFFCNIMVHAQKVYNGVMTGTSPHGILGPDPYDPYAKHVRTLLRIHPARGDMTQGCIGLITNNVDSLESIKRIFKLSLDSNDSIPLGVEILNR